VDNLVMTRLVFAAVVLGSLIALPPPSRVLAEGLFPDDAFYYFEIAANFVKGHGFSFDSINGTNGFQVLWLLILIPIALVVRNPDSFVGVVWWLQIFIAAGAAGLAFSLIEKSLKTPRLRVTSALVVSTLPFLPLWNGGMINGLETSVFSVAVLGSLLNLHRFLLSPSDRISWLLAASLTLAVLARVDALLLVGLTTAMLWLRRCGSRRQRFRIVALPGLVAAISFACNWLFFGSLSPVSGATKSIWADRQLQADLLAGQSEWRLRLTNIAWPKEYLEPLTSSLPASFASGLLLDITVVLLVLVAYFSIAWFYWGKALLALAVFQSFLVGKFLVYGYVQYGFANYIWYWTLDLISLVIFVAVLTRSTFARNKPLLDAVGMGVLAAFLLLGLLGNSLLQSGRAWLSPDPQTQEITEYSGARFTAETLNDSPITSDLLLASSDAGILGFYLDGPLVNTDGLVNGRERLDFTKRFGFDQLPYLLANPEFDGFVNWVPVGARETTSERMRQAGFEEVLNFSNCVSVSHGGASNQRGQFRLFLRREYAQSWSCPDRRGI
jgi:hypothetical protein